MKSYYIYKKLLKEERKAKHSAEERDYIVRDFTSSAKYLEVKGAPEIQKDRELQTEVECHKPATQQIAKKDFSCHFLLSLLFRSYSK